MKAVLNVETHLYCSQALEERNMDYGQACRQTFTYRITEGLPVIPSRIDAKRGHHFLQSDIAVLIGLGSKGLIDSQPLLFQMIGHSV